MSQNNVNDEQLINSLLLTIKVQGELIDMLRKEIQNLEAKEKVRNVFGLGTTTIHQGAFPSINTTPFISTVPLPPGSIQYNTTSDNPYPSGTVTLSTEFDGIRMTHLSR